MFKYIETYILELMSHKLSNNTGFFFQTTYKEIPCITLPHLTPTADWFEQLCTFQLSKQPDMSFSFPVQEGF